MVEIVSYSDDLVLALDRDAYAKALKFKQRYMYIAPHMRVVRLDKDLKYETDDRIRAIVTGTDSGSGVLSAAAESSCIV